MASRIRTHLLLQSFHVLDNDVSGWTVSPWQPRVDVYEMTDAIVILVEAPGLQLENLKLHFEPGSLLIEGFRSRPHLPDAARAALVEMNYGAFHRRFALPDDADGEGIGATYDLGILQITVKRLQDDAAPTVRVEIA